MIPGDPADTVIPVRRDPKKPSKLAKLALEKPNAQALVFYVDPTSWVPMWVQYTILWVRRALGKL